jgi:hypothetical protein
VAYLNRLRADVFDKVTAQWEKGGVSFETDPKRYTDRAKWINVSTGRGSLEVPRARGPRPERRLLQPALHVRAPDGDEPGFYAKLDPVVRRQALTDTANLAAVDMTVLGLANLSGASVEADPRSSTSARSAWGTRAWTCRAASRSGRGSSLKWRPGSGRPSPAALRA